MRRIAVRPATAADLDAAAALAASRSATKWTLPALREELGRPDSVFLVVPGTISGDSRADGGIGGYAVARLVDEELRLLDIVAAVDGSGVGRALWASLVEEGSRRGARRLTLEVSEHNERARGFYLAAGAIEAGTRPRFYPDGAAAILMDARLTTDNH